MAGSWIKHLLTYKIVDQTPIPCVPVASPGLKLKGMVCEELMLRRSQTGQTWLELQRQWMQRRQDYGPRCANFPRNITTFLPWWCWLTRSGWMPTQVQVSKEGGWLLWSWGVECSGKSSIYGYIRKELAIILLNFLPVTNVTTAESLQYRMRMSSLAGARWGEVQICAQ